MRFLWVRRMAGSECQVGTMVDNVEFILRFVTCSRVSPREGRKVEQVSLIRNRFLRLFFCTTVAKKRD